MRLTEKAGRLDEREREVAKHRGDAEVEMWVDDATRLNPRGRSRLLTMSVVPGPSASRGGIIVQPTYFTSSLYVDPCREDIEKLVQEFSQKYHENPVHSFSLFKSIWISSGWQWMHFKVFDAYARDAFLKVTIRLFMGAFSRIGACYINTLMDLSQSDWSELRTSWLASGPSMAFTSFTARSRPLLHLDCTRFLASRCRSVRCFRLCVI